MAAELMIALQEPILIQMMPPPAGTGPLAPQGGESLRQALKHPTPNVLSASWVNLGITRMMQPALVRILRYAMQGMALAPQPLKPPTRNV